MTGQLMDGGPAGRPTGEKKSHLTRWLVISLIVAVMVAIGGWVTFGVTHTQDAADNAKLASQLSSAEEDNATVRAALGVASDQRDALEATSDDVKARESAVTAKEDELKTREAAVKKAEDYKQQTTLEDGTTYTVGLTMKAGTYRADSTSSTCYWEITRSGSNYDDIVNNDLGAQGAITVTVRKGEDFTSNRCGNWSKVG